jgi:exonuclease 1
MGISGLLPIVAPLLQKKHISAYRSRTLGIDGHAWLYQILPQVAEDLFFKIPTARHIDMFRTKIKALQDYGITPLIVLDGDPLLSKEVTNDKRRARKERIRDDVEYWLGQNNPAKARALMRQCISVSREMVYEIARMLETENIEYIIAPYESDAQLCYLQKIGYVHAILTEDSDLIPYGANRVLYKFDGSFVNEFNQECLERAKGKLFRDRILDISILSGCDYLESIPGVGIVTAHRLLSRERSVEDTVERLKSAKAVPQNYICGFHRARKTFLHQIVYDPVGKRRRHLSATEERPNFLGTLEDAPYVIESSQAGSFFKPTSEARILRRHFSPLCKRRAEDVVVRSRRIVVDENLRSPYFME